MISFLRLYRTHVYVVCWKVLEVLPKGFTLFTGKVNSVTIPLAVRIMAEEISKTEDGETF